MFKRIMAPVDLAHLDKLERALNVVADEAKRHGASVAYVSVTAATPGPLGHNPEEFRARLEEFAAEQARKHDIKADAHMIVSHDPTTDIDDALMQAVSDTKADLVVMASHKPGLAEYFWPSNGGKISAHSSASVFVVRDN
ncbi:universal stress protein [Ruegeria sediminis]|uniref:Universal stress protein n=1 Tax=Ruegeria sediminis TaxID=2583820 RepID=A0ABY2X1P2_9RHOB|nr:universal stress protein [Ruegeria sediminis]TMV09155.1 universal stress protein [Ruegeria sediminis]